MLFTDPHAEVRCAAARRLGDMTAANLERAAPSSPAGARSPEPAALADWLIEALADRSSIVRDAALRGLARCARLDADGVDRVRACVAGDRVWWVRRTAIYALAAVAGADEIPR